MAMAATGMLCSQETEPGVLDLVNLHNYANQAVPAYITRDNTPPSNGITDMGATLGRVLFYDKRLSRNDTISCSSCHQQARGFSDLGDASTGVSGTTGRHSMRLINSRFAQERRFFWDERADTLEAQTTQPIQDHVEMGFSGTNGDPDLSDLVTKLGAIEEYQVLFRAVYGDAAITEDRLQRALAQFVRSIQSFDSKYDAGRAQVAGDNVDFPNYTAAENLGKALFLTPPGPGGGAGCAGCHRPPEFDITPNSGHNGVTGTLDGGQDLTVTRSPSLRDLVGPQGQSNGGFMHTAEFATIEQVIEHYNLIPAAEEGIDARLLRPDGSPQQLGLTNGQKANLAAFLRTLSGTAVYEDARWSDPFDEDGALSMVMLPTDGIELQLDGVGDDRTATVSMGAVPRVAYVFQWSSDLQTWNSTPVMAAPDGTVSAQLTGVSDLKACFFRFIYAPE